MGFRRYKEVYSAAFCLMSCLGCLVGIRGSIRREDIFEKDLVQQKTDKDVASGEEIFPERCM